MQGQKEAQTDSVSRFVFDEAVFGLQRTREVNGAASETRTRMDRSATTSK